MTFFLVCDSMKFNMCIDLCNIWDAKQFHRPRKHPYAALCSQTPLLPLTTNNLSSITYSFSRISYKQNHTVCNFLKMVSFTQHNALIFFHTTA